MFKSLGENATIYSLAKILYPENISIGAESVVDDFVFMYGAGKGIQIGKFCHITARCIIESGGLLEIGDFSTIAYSGIVMASSDDYKGNCLTGLGKFGEKYRTLYNLDTKIGRHVLVGAGSIILPGVTIGDGCSVGAGSLVTKDLPPWSLCYGSPCRVIEQKKSKEIRLQMEKEFLQEYEKGQKND
ncbi:MAG TPA: acyltransferase [Bacilli bacterium]|jgi:acetyltransferase-like isoleucine patch superfamily enzyme|nr:acyltransferase [Bacilli bacterium]HQM07591.1 acyltransferase [Bacilli bacterium]